MPLSPLLPLSWAPSLATPFRSFSVATWNLIRRCARRSFRPAVEFSLAIRLQSRARGVLPSSCSLHPNAARTFSPSPLPLPLPLSLLPLSLPPVTGKENRALGAATVDLRPGVLEHGLFVARLRTGPVIASLSHAFLARNDVNTTLVPIRRPIVDRGRRPRRSGGIGGAAINELHNDFRQD